GPDNAHHGAPFPPLPQAGEGKRSGASGFHALAQVSMALQAEHHQCALVGRHARERLTVKDLVVVSGKAAPASGHGDVLLAFRHVADDAAVMALTVVV